MKIAYIYIEEHKSISKISIPLVSKYDFKYSNNTLKIKKNQDYISNFYNGINVTAIVGKNGVGKTTILDFIESIYSYSLSSGFIIFMDRDEKFKTKYINHPEVQIECHEKLLNEFTYNDEKNLIIKIDNLCDFSGSKKKRKTQLINLSSEWRSSTKLRKRKQINSIFRYLGHRQNRIVPSMPSPAYKVNVRGWSSAIRKVIKDSYVRDMLHNKNGMKKICSEARNILKYSERVVKLNREEEKRLIDSIQNAKSMEELPDFIYDALLESSKVFLGKIEDYLCTSPRNSIISKFTFRSWLKIIDGFEFESDIKAGLHVIFLHFFTKKDLNRNSSPIFELEYQIDNFISLLKHERNDIHSKKLMHFKKNILEDFSFSYEAIVSFANIYEDKFIWTESESESELYDIAAFPLEPLPRILLDVLDISLPYEDDRYIGFSERNLVNNENLKLRNADEIFELLERVNDLPNTISDIIDHGWEGLSSGEFAKVSIFSSILDAINYTSDNSNTLVLIDEVDLYLHPEWQRTFISNLIELVKNEDCESKIQFLITTHSPLIIGDLLPEDIICLKRKDNKIVHEESMGFGALLSDFYLDGMHIDSTYGEHSRKLLQHLIDKKLKGIKYDKYEILLISKICNHSLKDALIDDKV